MLLSDGRLALLDFGLVARMTSVHQESMASAILNMMAAKYTDLVLCFFGMGILSTAVDDLRRPGVEATFTDALEDALGGGPDEGRLVQGGAQDRRRAFGQLYEELSSLAFEYYFRIPSYYMLVMRSFVTLEGIACGSDSDFNMYKTSYPYALRRLLTPKSREGKLLLRKALLGEPAKLVDAVPAGVIPRAPTNGAASHVDMSHLLGDSSNASSSEDLLTVLGIAAEVLVSKD
eukprot:1930772-Amphidinium_carterae.1